MTTTDIATRDTADLAYKVDYAKFLAAADLLPKAYQGKPANLLYAIEYGAMLGLPPIAAIVGIHVIDGRPTMSAGLMAAKVRQAGHRIRIQATGEGDGARARCTITRSDDTQFEYSATWTMERAKTAGLLGKTNWRQHPIQMLKNRATSECCRDACQEVLLGIAYTPDELGGEDDGGEVVFDGHPTLANGQLDQTQMSEQAKDAAGLMTRHDRVAHDQLRNMNKVDPGDVEHVTEAEDDDPWAKPERPPRTASRKATQHLADLFKQLDLGPKEDIDAVVAWLFGNTTYGGTAKQVADLTRFLESHLTACEGDVEKARDAVWVQYREMNPEDKPVDP